MIKRLIKKKGAMLPIKRISVTVMYVCVFFVWVCVRKRARERGALHVVDPSVTLSKAEDGCGCRWSCFCHLSQASTRQH